MHQRFQFDHIQSLFVGSAMDRRFPFTFDSNEWGTFRYLEYVVLMVGYLLGVMTLAPKKAQFSVI
jgi:hypothetical protein